MFLDFRVYSVGCLGFVFEFGNIKIFLHMYNVLRGDPSLNIKFISASLAPYTNSLKVILLNMSVCLHIAYDLSREIKVWNSPLEANVSTQVFSDFQIRDA